MGVLGGVYEMTRLDDDGVQVLALPARSDQIWKIAYQALAGNSLPLGFMVDWVTTLQSAHELRCRVKALWDQSPLGLDRRWCDVSDVDVVYRDCDLYIRVRLKGTPPNEVLHYAPFSKRNIEGIVSRIEREHDREFITQILQTTPGLTLDGNGEIFSPALIKSLCPLTHEYVSMAWLNSEEDIEVIAERMKQFDVGHMVIEFARLDRELSYLLDTFGTVHLFDRFAMTLNECDDSLRTVIGKYTANAESIRHPVVRPDTERRWFFED